MIHRADAPIKAPFGLCDSREERTEPGGWKVTVILDDGTLVFPPRQDTALAAYTRDALHIQEFEFPALPLREEILKVVVDGYPPGVRRAIIACTFESLHRILLSDTDLRFYVDT